MAADFDATEAGSLAIAVTEAASNLVKHAGTGEILLRQFDAGIEMLAIDKGPGIENLNDALKDGRSTAGTNGIGLGAISRMATLFEIYTGLGLGTVILARFQRTDRRHRAGENRAPELEIGAVQGPYPGEFVSGDAWSSEGTTFFVVDGLGHGIHAAEAADAAVQSFRENSARPVRDIVEAAHLALQPTRGAAVAAASIDLDAGVVRFCGIGNISGMIVDCGTTRGLMSHNGIAGHEVHRIAELEYPWPQGGTLVLHSDGLSAKWNLEAYPGLATRHPSLIAGVLYRDFRRQRDDATVVVARVCPPVDRGGRV
jgi:anti-sigma regulatory factor (Ser/Thr protein kinase)